MTDREFDAASTRLDVPDVQNFRDAGVAGLRAGLLYRSGSLNQLTEEGAQRLKALGVRTIVDLRSRTELEVWPDQRHGLDLDQLHLPLLPDHSETEQPWPTDQLSLYLFMAEVGGPAIAGTVRRLVADGGTPLLVHCAVGKDRTGLTIAVIQSLAGVPEADIIVDFLRSNPNLGLDAGPVPYIDEHGEEHLSRPVLADHLRASLDRIRELHGSLADFLRAHGVTDEELASLRELLAP
ncbi:tyrosine-protein phosphatase [Kitasatospora atroaurantiaca]|uniref:Protein-tyrosine phosphatase n=1 Tax=Kitasatospora atroaurantiaca TaxID=285545 RepID=A0A561ETD1_9ACTN|nr:tyrosine-protein phosphatase [Kitasatospora atroaurantiaca]TWE18847.1 protein-tyrosine phosphatase [Kitasatospora atroaurantiaca]